MDLTMMILNNKSSETIKKIKRKNNMVKKENLEMIMIKEIGKDRKKIKIKIMA